ncbi:MAG TPA: hypothetical protein VGM10_04635 [Actinocrinis sp.]
MNDNLLPKVVPPSIEDISRDEAAKLIEAHLLDLDAFVATATGRLVVIGLVDRLCHLPLTLLVDGTCNSSIFLINRVPASVHLTAEVDHRIRNVEHLLELTASDTTAVVIIPKSAVSASEVGTALNCEIPAHGIDDVIQVRSPGDSDEPVPLLSSAVISAQRFQRGGDTARPQ